ncbi:MAG: hypothetical protein WB696_30285 [Chthoniobacterales bacterium]|jgi:hypothetical protein
MPKLRLLISFFLRGRIPLFVLTCAALSPLKPFVQDFLTAVGGIVRDFLSFFRGFNEDDARALLSAYGFCAFEVDHLQNNRPNEEIEVNGNFADARRFKHVDRFPGPIPVGVHPDLLTRIKRRNHAHQ